MQFTKDELKAKLEAHVLWLNNKGGERLVLQSDANLSRADLSGANLSRADLSGADLSDANLSGANLSDADLSWANLSRADLSGANLSRADLSGANLSDADLSWADLSGADLYMSSIPIWCGGTRIEVDRRIGLQLLYHFVAQTHNDAECIELAKTLAPVADKFRVEFRNDAPALPLV